MQAIVFCGIQGSGKSTFYRERFFDTHVRINRDMLRTDRRVAVLLEACIAARQPFVSDNTNPTPAERRRYLEPALAAGFEAVGYWFDSPVRDAIRRNQGRPRDRRIPVPGVIGTHRRLERPTRGEGFRAVYRVTITDRSGFAVESLEESATSGGGPFAAPRRG